MKNILPTIITSALVCLFMTVSTAFAGDGILGNKYKNSHYYKQAPQASNLESIEERTPELNENEEPVYCGDILSEPGFYGLDTDLECTSSIQITSSDVYLNFNGHSLTCLADAWEYPDPLGVPEGDRDLWVKGISVNFNSFGDPLLEPAITNVHISNGTVSNCSQGILLYKVDRSTVTRMTLRDNVLDTSCCWARGLVVVDSHTNTIIRNTMSANHWGIAMIHATGNVLERNYVNNNIRSGIYFLGSDRNKLIDNTTIRNLGGVWLESSGDNTIEENKMSANANAGLLLYGKSRGNQIINNQADGNSIAGIVMAGATVAGEPIGAPIPVGNFIEGNSAFGNPIDMGEFYLDYSDFDFTDFEFVPGDRCYNTWLNNAYDTPFGMANCIN